MKRIIFVIAILLMSITVYADARERVVVKSDKVIFETSDHKSDNIRFQPDYIYGIWHAYSDKNKGFFSDNFKTGLVGCFLIIHKNEISGEAVLYDLKKEKVIERVRFDIKKTGTGRYDFILNKKKRQVQIAYMEYDGNMYLHFVDVSAYKPSGSYNAFLYSRDYSDKVIQKLLEEEINDLKREGGDLSE